ncbi:MAG TPA: hypothetical protein DF296_07145 [Candidatus Margulisbacteria bacterium]|nr:hypothetical protein [Candidatus Margulisiibacteriota bacterium]
MPHKEKINLFAVKGNCTKLFKDSCQKLSNIYLEKADRATSEDQKKYFYNHVLYYSGMKAAIEELSVALIENVRT